MDDVEFLVLKMELPWYCLFHFQSALLGRSLGSSGQQHCEKAFGDCQGPGVEGPEKALLSESGGGWGEFYFLKKKRCE